MKSIITPLVNERAATKIQLAHALQCRPPLVAKLQKANVIPSYRLGRLLRFDINACIEALAKNTEAKNEAKT